MEAINNMMIDRAKNAFTTPATTLRDIADRKDPVKINQDTSQAINNPADNVKVTEVPKGKINKVLKEFDDKTVKGQAKAEHVEGKEPNTIPGDVIRNEHQAPAVI